MVTYRFSGRHSLPTILTEKGQRWDKRDGTEKPSDSRSPDKERHSPGIPPSSPDMAQLVAEAADWPEPAPPASHSMAIPIKLSEPSTATVTVVTLRRRIMESSVVDRLIEFIEGRCQLSRDQVAAAIALVGKVIPDLASITLPPEGSDTNAEDSPEFEIHIVDPKA